VRWYFIHVVGWRTWLCQIARSALDHFRSGRGGGDGRRTRLDVAACAEVFGDGLSPRWVGAAQPRRASAVIALGSSATWTAMPPPRARHQQDGVLGGSTPWRLEEKVRNDVLA
jgi:hypothetical protein